MTRHCNYKSLKPSDIDLAMKMLGRAAIMGLKVEAVGSRSIDGAATRTSHIDYVVLDKSVDRHTFAYWLERNSFEKGGSEVEGEEFKSYKKDNVNFIVTQSEDFYKKFLSANIVAQVHKVRDKDDRITIFDHIIGRRTHEKEKYDYILANGNSRGYIEAVPF